MEYSQDLLENNIFVFVQKKFIGPTLYLEKGLVPYGISIINNTLLEWLFSLNGSLMGMVHVLY